MGEQRASLLRIETAASEAGQDIGQVVSNMFVLTRRVATATNFANA